MAATVHRGRAGGAAQSNPCPYLRDVSTYDNARYALERFRERMSPNAPRDLFADTTTKIDEMLRQSAGEVTPDLTPVPAPTPDPGAIEPKPSNRTGLLADPVGLIAALLIVGLIGLPRINQATTGSTATSTTAPPTPIVLQASNAANTVMGVSRIPPTVMPTLPPTIVLIAAPTVTSALTLSVFDQGRTQRAVFQTMTATQWTATSTPSPTVDPNIIQNAVLTLSAATDLGATDTEQANLNQPATAWTVTPTSTPTIEWTPQFQDFNGVKMVKVPEDCFLMGPNGNGPITGQCFKAFWIDMIPFQEQFKRFKGVAAKPSFFRGSMLPVEEITWAEANNYCKNNRGARLPTEAEWEYAARGPNNLSYPWGNTFDKTKAVYADNSGYNPKTNSGGSTAAVNRTIGSHRRGSGATDMSGNVWQWTSSINMPYPYVANDGRENDQDINSPRVTRGGSWRDPNDPNDPNNESLKATNTFVPLALPIPQKDGYNIGFRCARSADL